MIQIVSIYLQPYFPNAESKIRSIFANYCFKSMGTQLSNTTLSVKLDSYQDAPQQAINYVILSSNECSFFTLQNKMEFWIITNDQKQMINCCNRNLDLAGCHKIYFNLTHFIVLIFPLIKTCILAVAKVGIKQKEKNIR